MTDHADIRIACIAQATSRDAEWIGRLSDEDGQALSDAMWSANGRFFRAPPRRDREAAPEGRPVPLADVLNALVRVGHGRGHRDVAERLTWRQIRRLWEVEARRRAEDVERLGAMLVGGG